MMPKRHLSSHLELSWIKLKSLNAASLVSLTAHTATENEVLGKRSPSKAFPLLPVRLRAYVTITAGHNLAHTVSISDAASSCRPCSSLPDMARGTALQAAPFPTEGFPTRARGRGSQAAPDGATAATSRRACTSLTTRISKHPRNMPRKAF